MSTESRKEISQEPLLVIPTSGIFNKKRANIFQDFLEFNGKILNYNSCTAICYYNTKHSVNAIPTSLSYTFKLLSEDQCISFETGTRYTRKDIQQKSDFIKFIKFAKNRIEPFILNKLCTNLSNGQIFKIGKITISKDGLSYKSWWGRINQISWSQISHNPVLEHGNVVIFKDHLKYNYVPFCRISLYDNNAVILPELIDKCRALFCSTTSSRT